METAEQLCSRCRERPRADADSTNPWCKECRAEYQRGYQKEKLTREQRKGFVSGVRAMRELLAAEFFQIGSAGFTGYEIAELIVRAPGPQLTD